MLIYFLILTDVEKAKINYGKPDEKALDKITFDQSKNILKKAHNIIKNENI